MKQAVVLLLFFSHILCDPSPIWEDLNSIKAVSPLDIIHLNSGADVGNLENEAVRFDGVRLRNGNGTVTFDFWGKWVTDTASVDAPVMFRVSDSQNWIIISPLATDGSSRPSLLYSYNNGPAQRIDLAGSNPSALYWYHIALALTPSASGSYLKISRGDPVTGAPISWTTQFPFYGFTNPNNLSVAVGLDPTWAQEHTNPPIQPISMRIGALRMWNTFITQTQMDPLRFVNPQGNEPNLEHNWLLNFDSKTAEDRITTVSRRIAPSFVAGTMEVMIVSASKTPAVLYFNFYRTLPYNGEMEVEVASNQFPIPVAEGNRLGLVPYPNVPFTGPMCVVYSNNTCLPIGRDMNLPTTLTTYRFRSVGTRASCGVSFVFSSTIVFTRGTNTAESNLFTINVDIGSFNLTDNIISVIQPETTGGIFTIIGQNFGLDGPLAAGETVVLTDNLDQLTCMNPMVSGVGTIITCTVPEGKGLKRAKVVFSMCKKQAEREILFGYKPPAPTSVSGLASFTKISIVGSNFGPNMEGSHVTITGTNYRSDCKISQLNHTDIFCEVDTPLANLGNYTANVTIGNQMQMIGFIFQICTPACQNGGVCGTDGACTCSQNFKGKSCEIAVVCNPPCANGECRASSTDPTKNFCQCPDNIKYIGELCVRKVTDLPAGSIVGIVIGGAVLIIIGVSVAYFVIKRTERREGANFVPLDKKDFTKIIYGEQLHQVPEKGSANDFRDLERLLVEDENLELAFAISNITQITDADRIAKAMIVVFQEHNRVIKLLEDFVSHEVKVAESAGTLFRANSMVSKMFKFYSRLIGLPYLYVTIGPELGKLIEEQLGLEVDPEKMEEGRDLDEMRWALMSQSQKILKQILISEDDCPPQFRRLFAHISAAVGSRFPDNINTTIGGFVFLRLFCPAVSSPEAYGIVEEPPSADARRLLILITKVMQNLSNDVEFGSKEPYMTKMNDFIQSNRQKLTVFYEKLLKIGSKPDVECEIPRNIKPISLAILADHLKENMDSIEDEQLVAKLKAVLPNL